MIGEQPPAAPCRAARGRVDLEEKMMSLRTSRALATAVALAAATAGTALVVQPASAATAECGSYCTSFYPLSIGTSDVLAVENPSGTSASVGQPVTIAAASSDNQGEDWVFEDEGTVDDFVAAMLMSPEMGLHWGSDQVYQIVYAPDFTYTGLCLGTSTTDGTGAVSLQPCGETAAALWVADTADMSGRALPLINGDNDNFAFPESLTAASPGDQLTSSELIPINPITINPDQEWGTIDGEL
jgi:hypothetical protein